jgi:hypothetical protein
VSWKCVGKCLSLKVASFNSSPSSMSIFFILIISYYVVCRFRVAGNVWRICPVRLSKHHLSKPPNVYFEDNCFLASHKKRSAKQANVRARAMTESRRIGRICCYRAFLFIIIVIVRRWISS